MEMADRKRLGPGDWADAALDVLAEGGLRAVAVEPIAARLGATKGSFYWHFANREALVEAALDRWAEVNTESVIRDLDGMADPGERLRRLFSAVLGRGTANRAELALLAHADDPLVAPMLARMTQRRVDFISTCLRELGYPEPEARYRAVLAYTAYIGLMQAERASGGALLAGENRAGYLEFLQVIIAP
jgi:AcrR family transcriptional regulator